MDISELVDEEMQETIIGTWADMSENDKGHFINQVALAMSIWGSDRNGRTMVVEVLRFMADNQTSTLADFGLYIERALINEEGSRGQLNKIRRASMVIEGYRIKNALSSIPHKDLGL
jgi:hypothetical protein